MPLPSDCIWNDFEESPSVLLWELWKSMGSAISYTFVQFYNNKTITEKSGLLWIVFLALFFTPVSATQFNVLTEMQIFQLTV